MLRNYFKIAWRNLVKSKGYSLINIGGLAMGLAVTMMIGLWTWDEVSFDQYNRNYKRIAQVYQNQLLNNSIDTWPTMPYPMGETLRNQYGSDFERVVMTSWDFYELLGTEEKKLKKRGRYFEPGGPGMFDLKMVRGDVNDLTDPGALLISETTARAYFGDADPIGKTMVVNNRNKYLVQGVYKDLPQNSTFGQLDYLGPWETYINNMPWIKKHSNPWGNNSFQVYVQLAEHADMQKVSDKIRDVRYDHLQADEKRFHPELFLHPMSKWHLHESFKNGVNEGGSIRFVWKFGVIGIFVLLLACINFMNLSTARSEKRAREVGIRKSVGSLRSQLIGQFFSESLLVSVAGCLFALVLIQLSLPLFNTIADKKIHIPWSSPAFWGICVAVTAFTGLIAGSYPAFYLSSFQPVKVLKGTFRAGRNAALPRKVLVVTQFAVSVILITGTLVIFQQIRFAMNRPAGYSREGVISIQSGVKHIHEHFDAMRADLIATGGVVEMAQASSPATGVWSTSGGLEWEGKDPSQGVDFPTVSVSEEYAKTIGWQFKDGRNFSRQFASDSTAFVLNESAVKFMGLKNPVGKIVRWDGVNFTIIGVIKDMIMESPYTPVRPSMYIMDSSDWGIVNIKLNPRLSSHEALALVEPVYKKYVPDYPFDYKFVDDEYAKKFGNEERTGKLAGIFAMLAIFISCLGLFGMASFMAEKRTKEIGVRKVMGASVFNLWQLLSKDFVMLVCISLLIATPLAYYLMHNWLLQYEYRTSLSWWIFVAAGGGILLLTLATVSFQSIKAALMNPVKSLRSE